MTAIDRMRAAIERLELLEDTLGKVVLTADDVLLLQADDDTDDDGNRFMFGVTLWDSDNPDYDVEQSYALETIVGTIGAQIAVLRFAVDGLYDLPEFIALADAVLAGQAPMDSEANK